MIVFGIVGMGLILAVAWHELQVWRGIRAPDQEPVPTRPIARAGLQRVEI